MATLLKTLTKTFGTYYTLKVYVYSKSQSVANNTTDVYYEAYVDIGSGWINSSASKNWSGKIGDYSVSGTYAFGDIPKGSAEKKLLTSATKTITHGSDGKKTIDVSCTINVNLTLGGSNVSTVTASGSVDLPQIARASSISSANDVTVNGSNKSTVSISAKNSSYSHKVNWSIGSYSHDETVAAGTTSVSYAIPASWLNAIPNAKTGQLKITLKTYSGSTQIGSPATKNITISVPDTSSYKPTYTAALSDAAGAYDKVGVYVKGKSKFKVDLTSISGKYSATIKEIKIIMCGTTYKPAAGSSASATTGVVNTVGDNTIEITVTDSRGYSTLKTLTATVVAYTNPYFAELAISRYKKEANGSYTKDDDGGYAKIEYTASVSSVGSNAFVECLISYKAAVPGSTESSVKLTSINGLTYVAVDTELVYNFELSLKDKLSEVVYKKQLSSAGTIMDVLKGGKGVCFGGVASLAETFDLRWKLLCNKPVVPKAGQQIHEADGTRGQKGYVQVALLKVDTAYANAPIVICALQRGKMQTRYQILFESVSTTDPGIKSFTYSGFARAYLAKTETSEWGLYIEKTEGYDRICITQYYISPYQMSTMTLEWTNVQISSLPDGYIMSMPEVVNDAGWIAVSSFLNSFSQASTAWESKCKYRKIGNHVYLKGCVKTPSSWTGSTPTTVLQLPDGYRPKTRVYKLTSATAGRVVRFFADTDGKVMIDWTLNISDGSFAGGELSWIQLDIDFLTD